LKSILIIVEPTKHTQKSVGAEIKIFHMQKCKLWSSLSSLVHNKVYI